MDSDKTRTPPRQPSLRATYEHLLTLWTSGSRDYHNMLSAYLTANSIFVAVIGVMVSRESLALPFTILIILLSVFGILLCWQMAIVLGRFSRRNALWEWQLRGIEQAPEWQERQLISDLYRLHEMQLPIEDLRNEPSVFRPNWAFRQRRQWWAHRAVSFPWFFGCVYGLFLLWAATQLVQQLIS
ncbi:MULTISPECIES: hypothetical protein [unclassified Nitrosomonas]|uniref:RipA family octameric membrane protein n=1 Tax=unclassified Nitrosomonas TaxID=2609265 RepID=UPI000884CC79|nr:MULTISPECIES: hypothetical protein [unclassified Nitrosomonas]SDH69283.1 hypothetical protein SAMN05428952_102441 [Nitrosomonas sp. Nm132]SDY74672.1 hypothetical protein SAMN05421754_102011 [Nitrosomonas sp. Nm58]